VKNIAHKLFRAKEKHVYLSKYTNIGNSIASTTSGFFHSGNFF